MLRVQVGIKIALLDSTDHFVLVGWNKSVFLDKEGKYPAAHTSGKPCGFREFRADPWYRAKNRYG